MPLAKQRKGGANSGFTFINVAHPDEIRQRNTQRAIRSGAMATIGRARRKGPEKPIVIELDMIQAEGTASDRNDGLESGMPAAAHLYSVLPAGARVPPALPHLGIFAVEPDMRARELFHFSMQNPYLAHIPLIR